MLICGQASDFTVYTCAVAQLKRVYTCVLCSTLVRSQAYNYTFFMLYYVSSTQL
jgi:hypothetical protein